MALGPVPRVVVQKSSPGQKRLFMEARFTPCPPLGSDGSLVPAELYPRSDDASSKALWRERREKWEYSFFKTILF